MTQLSKLLADCVNEGASLGFLPPIDADTAADYWHGVGCDMHSGGREVLVALEGASVVGAVHLAFPEKANASHRCEVQKLMVQPRVRKRLKFLSLSAPPAAGGGAHAI